MFYYFVGTRFANLDPIQSKNALCTLFAGLRSFIKSSLQMLSYTEPCAFECQPEHDTPTVFSPRANFLTAGRPEHGIDRIFYILA